MRGKGLRGVKQEKKKIEKNNPLYPNRDPHQKLERGRKSQGGNPISGSGKDKKHEAGLFSEKSRFE